MPDQTITLTEDEQELIGGIIDFFLDRASLVTEEESALIDKLRGVTH